MSTVTESADATRFIAKTCWDTCLLCDRTMKERKHKKEALRLYRECRHHEEKCFERTVICEHVEYRQPPPQPRKPSLVDY